MHTVPRNCKDRSETVGGKRQILTFSTITEQPTWSPELHHIPNLQAIQVLRHLPSFRKFGVHTFQINLMKQRGRKCVYAYICVCMYACNVYVCMHVTCMYVCVCIRARVCTPATANAETSENNLRCWSVSFILFETGSYLSCSWKATWPPNSEFMGILRYPPPISQ